MKLAKISIWLPLALWMLAVSGASAQVATSTSTAANLKAQRVAALAAAMAAQSPCKAEVKEFCQGNATYPACLKGHEASFSSGCKAAMAQEHKSFRQACSQDSQTFCPGLKGRALFDCLHQNQSKLSPLCAKYAAYARPQRATPPAAPTH